MTNKLTDEQETVRSVFGAYINDLKAYSSKPDRPMFRRLEEVRDKAINARESQRWIPVSERLPKAGEYVGDVAKYYLVQNEYGDMLVARYTHSGYWEQIYQLKPYDDEIVAWMPLPESYKAESEDVE